jgi:predicted transcriptional regulator
MKRKEKKPDLRRRLYREMKKRGMNQTQLANVLGVSRQQISMFFRGCIGLNFDNTEKLLDYFDLIKEEEEVKERPTYL